MGTGYYSRLNGLVDLFGTAVDGVTLANGYPLAIKSTSKSLSEDPFARPTGEFPRAYIYITPGTSGGVTVIDNTTREVAHTITVDVWAITQGETARESLPKHATSVIRAVKVAWAAASDLRTACTVGAGSISYHYFTEAKKGVARVEFAVTVRYAETDLT